jgi:anti-sigma B factor antagonist
MKVNVRQHGKVSVVDLSGKITIGEGDVQLRQAVEQLLKDNRKHVLLNLKGVSYMDSAGIGELVACSKRSAERKGTIKLLNPGGKVYELLILTKLIEVFEVFKDERDALASF